MSEELEKPKEKKPARIEYVGNGKFLQGLPARHLTLDEWKELPAKLQRHVIKLGLYEVKYD